jgi:hypothetical protein
MDAFRADVKVGKTPPQIAGGRAGVCSTRSRPLFGNMNPDTSVMGCFALERMQQLISAQGRHYIETQRTGIAWRVHGTVKCVRYEARSAGLGGRRRLLPDIGEISLRW